MNILFLCVANSARSQIAEGLARKIFGNKFDIQSAGSKPSKLVHPLAIEVLREIGIDSSAHFSKGIDDLPNTFLHQLDFVITLCEDEKCPFLPGQFNRQSWALPDPASSVAENIENFRKVRDSIEMKLNLLKESFENVPTRET